MGLFGAEKDAFENMRNPTKKMYIPISLASRLRVTSCSCSVCGRPLFGLLFVPTEEDGDDSDSDSGRSTIAGEEQCFGA